MYAARMDKTQLYLATIRQVFPDLVSGEPRCRAAAGQFNDVLIIDNKLIFRFPKYAQGVATILREIEILQAIRDHVRLPVPDPLFSRLDTNTVGQVFMGYLSIPGTPLWRDVLPAIRDEAVCDHLAAQLAGFLLDLHSIPEGLGPKA